MKKNAHYIREITVGITVCVLVVDAMAKIPSGLSDGQLMWTASFFMCNDIQTTYNYTNVTSNDFEDDRAIQGLHCRLPFKPPGVCLLKF